MSFKTVIPVSIAIQESHHYLKIPEFRFASSHGRWRLAEGQAGMTMRCLGFI